MAKLTDFGSLYGEGETLASNRFLNKYIYITLKRYVLSELQQRRMSKSGEVLKKPSVPVSQSGLNLVSCQPDCGDLRLGQTTIMGNCCSVFSSVKRQRNLQFL